MRTPFAVFGALMLATATAPLAAQELPWCVKLDVFTKNCAFAKYDECVTVAKNANSQATGVAECVRNPDYQPPAAAARNKPSPRKPADPQR